MVLMLKAAEPARGRLYIGVSEGSSTPIIVVSTSIMLDDGVTEVRSRLHDLPLPRGRYSIWVHLETGRQEELIGWHPATSFTLAGTDLDKAPTAVVRLSPVHVRAEWNRHHLG